MASKARQFAAVLQKNFILQIRGRHSLFGLGGLPALLLQISLPALFFALMCIPKYYIQPYDHPVYLQQSESDMDTRWWAGASPYEGAQGPACWSQSRVATQCCASLLHTCLSPHSCCPCKGGSSVHIGPQRMKQQWVSLCARRRSCPCCWWQGAHRAGP